jgi:hypothetical protein
MVKQKLKDTQLFQKWFFVSKESNFNSMKFWEEIGFMENNKKNQYLADLYTKAYEWMCTNLKNDNKIHHCILPIVYRVYNSLLQHDENINIDIYELLDDINLNLGRLLNYFNKNFSDCDWEAECTSTYSNNYYEKTLKMLKLKETNPEKYKYIVREKKLKRIIE